MYGLVTETRESGMGRSRPRVFRPSCVGRPARFSNYLKDQGFCTGNCFAGGDRAF